MGIKIERPTWFYHGAEMWLIKYFKQESTNHGFTDRVSKQIHIYLKDSDEATIRDTLLHELDHVIYTDIFEFVLPHMESPTHDDIEECFIRLTGTRRMVVYCSNPLLINYLFQSEPLKQKGIVK